MIKDMERKRLLPEEFLNYVTKRISYEEMRMWVKVNNINVEKTELFFDLVISLFYLIEETYLGKDVIKTEEDKKGHFDWCWKITLDNFDKENIKFNYKGEHYNYFYHFFYEGFYNNEIDDKISKLKKFLVELFQLYKLKTESELDVLSEIYKILENNLTVNK